MKIGEWSLCGSGREQETIIVKYAQYTPRQIPTLPTKGKDFTVVLSQLAEGQCSSASRQKWSSSYSTSPFVSIKRGQGNKAASLGKHGKVTVPSPKTTERMRINYTFIKFSLSPNLTSIPTGLHIITVDYI